MNTLDINGSVLFSILGLLGPAVFKEKFNSVEISLKSFLRLVAAAVAPAAKKGMERTVVKVLRRKSALRELQFLRGEILALRELDTEETRKLLIASQLLHAYAAKDARIQELLFHVSCKRNLPGSLLKSARF